MTDLEKVIEGLEMSYRYSNVDEDNTLAPQQLVLDALSLLKAQKPVEPTRYDSTLYLCGSCHYAIPRVVNYCPNCGRAVKWE